MQIFRLLFILICLTLKTYFAIGFIRIAVFYKPDEILKKVPDEEKDDEQFGLLLQVNSLMIHENRVIYELFLFDHNKWPKHNTVELLGQKVLIYYH